MGFKKDLGTFPTIADEILVTYIQILWRQLTIYPGIVTWTTHCGLKLRKPRNCNRSSSAAVRCSRSLFATVRYSKSSSAVVRCSRLVFIAICAAAVHWRKRHREDLRCSRVSLLYSRGSNAAKTSATAVKTFVFCHEDYTVKVPTQLQGWECGYYVMKFMREVITQQELIIPENYFVGVRCSYFTMEQIEDLVEELSEYIISCL
ncbi:uncharacterized protein LOC129315627 [Prosopis cineraria]|uniref:uncharacterized protein LOC129315627 n=1 Tax=Prosopis cineraria TaxID=364024 RepID=UPI0024103EA4|nr:uncharacterized protein LOC129315627 [Prosopis cineraria]